MGTADGHESYSVGDAVQEFREMVKAFHEARIEVWLDVVYNHTCEAHASGPTYSLRGMDNSSYYLLHPDGSYRDETESIPLTEYFPIRARTPNTTGLGAISES